MEGFLIGFLFNAARKIFKWFFRLFVENGIGKCMIWKFKNDDKVIAECEAYYGNSRDLFGEEY